jgi:PAS domain S-box-containing protein
MTDDLGNDEPAPTEELTTLNQENRHKLEELRMLSGDLQNLLVGTDIATLFLDRQLRILRFTPRIGELFNVRHTDRGRPLGDLTHQLRYDQIHADAAGVLDRLVPVERQVQSHDGRWFLTRVLPYRTTDDHIDGVVITFVDITRRRIAEAGLRDSEKQLRLALEASEMGTWSWDLVDDVISADRRTLDILGLPDDRRMTFQLLVDECIPQEERASLRAAADRAIAAGDDDAFSVEVPLSNSRVGATWVLVSGRRYASEDDPTTLERLTGTVLDISERKHAEELLTRRVEAQTEEIRRTERRFRALVEASSQIVWNADADGRISEDAPQWRAFTGQSVEELRTSGWPRSVHPDDRDAAVTAWTEALVAQSAFHAEFRICHAPSSSWRWVAARAVPLRDDHGSLHGWVGMVTDIDERRRAENKVRALASRVTMAEHEERRRIAQVLHDDLQQRLYSLQMKIGLVHEQMEAAGVGDASTSIDEIEQRLAETVDITRYLAVELSPPILEHEGLADALEWLASQMQQMHGLDVEVRTGETFTISDHDMRVFLFQITRELLFNVVKHAGVPKATVELAREDSRLRIVVTDEGDGFDVTDGWTTEGPATGFGLTNAGERLDLFGGDITVASKPGDGTVVTVRIPLPDGGG